jgi:hypothetical protein
MRGTAVVWFGPIKIDISVKQILSNIVYSGHTLFPIFTIKDKEKEATMKINENEIIIIDSKT